MAKHRLIAINLPQFHPFKENDEWWGKGFTEWTNVTKAKPRFKGHYQPHLPTDTGFYDLRLPEARQMQADMAREAGIYGFCYYHYWFNGHQLMERPVNDMIKMGEPDFPFMLCWANENWARNWDGGFKDVLIEQKYSEEDDVKHMRWLCENVFSDERYIRVDGRPFFVVYKPYIFPDVNNTIAIWRKIAAEYGEELYLGFMLNGNIDRKTLLDNCFDVAVEFQPKFLVDHPLSINDKGNWFKYRVRRKISSIIGRRFIADPDVWDYKQFVDIQMKEQDESTIKEYPCVTPRWDNAPRRKGNNFWALYNEAPELYARWLSHLLKTFSPFSPEENFIFINAWNEWAEGNHLEPDVKWGNAYIDETKNAIEND